MGAIKLYNDAREKRGEKAGRVMMLSCMMMDCKNNTAIQDAVTLIHTYRKAGLSVVEFDAESASSCYSRALELYRHVGLRAITDIIQGIQLETVLSGILDLCLVQSRLLWMINGKQHCDKIMAVLEEAVNLLPYCGQHFQEIADTFAEMGGLLQAEGDHEWTIKFFNKALEIVDMSPAKAGADSATWMLHLALSYLSVDLEKAASCLNLVAGDPRSLLLQVKLHTMSADPTGAQASFRKLCEESSVSPTCWCFCFFLVGGQHCICVLLHIWHVLKLPRLRLKWPFKGHMKL
jgi:hypothetical protein